MLKKIRRRQRTEAECFLKTKKGPAGFGWPSLYLLDLQSPAGGYGLGLLGQRQLQDAVLIGGGNLLAADAGDVEAAGEGPVGPLAADIVAVLILLLPAGGALGADGEAVTVHVDVDILLLHPRQIGLQHEGVAGVLDVGLESPETGAGEEAPLQLLQVPEGAVQVHAAAAGKGHHFKHSS